MKKTVLAVLVATTAISGAAQASNVDVNYFIKVAQSGTNIANSKAVYSHLNQRDKSMVDHVAPMAGISDEIMGQIQRADARNQQAHFVMTSSTKVEADEIIKGSPLKRAIINHMEHNEAINHGARFGGMTSQRDIADVDAEEVAAQQAAIKVAAQQARDQAETDHINDAVVKAHDANAQIVANKIEAARIIRADNEKTAAASRLDSMKPDYNAVVVATHDANAIEAQKQIIKAREDQVRAQAETDHINEAVMQAHDANAQIVANRIEAHKLIARSEADAAASRLDSMKPDYNAVVVATHDVEAANVAGKLKVAANVARTASQQVIPEQAAADTRLNSMAVDPNAEVVAAHDAQAYDVAQGVARKADNANRTSIQHVDGNAVAIADNTMDIATNTAGVAANKAGVAQTTAKLDSVTYDIAGNRRDISSLATRAADTDERIAETKAEQAKTNERVSANSAAIADHENRIESLESETTSKFSSLKNKVEENRKRASAGIAGVAAMANIPQVTDTQNFSVGAGVGNTDSESALAVGMSARATENVVVKTSVSNDTQHNFVVGAGVSYGW